MGLFGDVLGHIRVPFWCCLGMSWATFELLAAPVWLFTDVFMFLLCSSGVFLATTLAYRLISTATGRKLT